MGCHDRYRFVVLARVCGHGPRRSGRSDGVKAGAAL
jgi:hypothetical protein